MCPAQQDGVDDEGLELMFAACCYSHERADDMLW